MKKMMKRCWLMMGLLTITMVPSLMSCSDDDNDTKKEEPPVPFLKINGGDVSFTIDQYEMTVASIEANNEVELVEKPDWIEAVSLSKNVDGTYAAIITRSKINDTELRSGFITFAASTATAKVAVSCGAQSLDASYTVANSMAPTAGFFGEKEFGFSVLRAASTDRDSVLVYIYAGKMMGYMPAVNVSITPEKAGTSEAVSSSYYTVRMPEINDLYASAITSYAFFVVNASLAEDFNPNAGRPGPEPTFSVLQYNTAYSLLASVTELELTAGKETEVTVVYDNTVVPKLKIFVGGGWPDFYAEDPVADMDVVENVTVTQKSSSTDGKYTTVVYTISAVEGEINDGDIIFFAMDAADEYIRDEGGMCIVGEVMYYIMDLVW